MIQDLRERLRRAEQERDTLQARVKELEMALKWYANSGEPGEFFIHHKSGVFISDMHGWGERARQALRANSEGK